LLTPEKGPLGILPVRAGEGVEACHEVLGTRVAFCRHLAGPNGGLREIQGRCAVLSVEVRPQKLPA
jgi:hypothetical protein